MNRTVVVMGVCIGVLTVSACSANRTDRGSGADDFKDVSQVTVWRNIDDAPNLVMFCADSRAWVATLNSEDNTGRGFLVRDADADRRCQG